MDFGDPALNDLASTIERDIFTADPNVPWDAVAGLDTAKRLLREAVVSPVRFPRLFVGLLAPWRGVLLYGPPGTGKTMLAKAVATECETTFFNIGASTVISKWRGDSEKLVRVLFDLARLRAPSTVFLDEIDALMSARGGGSGGAGEHEASRRMKTEILIQMDGLRGPSSHDPSDPPSASRVFVLAATNLPWELDLALLRRLEKRVLVDLPCEAARARIVRELLRPHAKAPGVDPEAVARATEGFSGSDAATLCKEMARRPLRRLVRDVDAPRGGGGRGRGRGRRRGGGEGGNGGGGAGPSAVGRGADHGGGREEGHRGDETVRGAPSAEVRRVERKVRRARGLMSSRGD